MTDDALDIASAVAFGKVARVDTNRVLINVQDDDAVTRMSVGNLVAIDGTLSTEYLVGIVDAITRALSDETVLDEVTDEKLNVAEPRDVVRVALVGTFRTKYGNESNVFKRGADSFPQIDRDARLLEGPLLQGFMSSLSAHVPDNKRLGLGRFVADTNAMAIADGNRLFQRHAALLGSTGAGKSWTVALILERARQLDFPNLIVLDMHGEYGPLTQERESGNPAIATSMRIAGPGDSPEDPSVLFLPYWLLTHEELTALLIDQTEQTAHNQHARIAHHVLELKRESLQGNQYREVRETFTLDSPIPYRITDLIERLNGDNTERVARGDGKGTKQGDYYGRFGRLIARIESKVADRRYGFLFAPPDNTLDYEWLPVIAQRLLGSSSTVPGIKVIDFSEVPSDVLPLVAAVLGRSLYDVQFWMAPDRRTPLCFVCDEAHLYLPVRDEGGVVQERALGVFERIAKEGRKYGVALMVISQRPADVSRTILSQCNNFIVMRLTNDRDQSVVRRLMPDALASLVDIVPLLDRGEALILGDAMVLPTRVRLDKPSVHPDSRTRDFWTDWAELSPEADSIAAGVEALRRQSRER